MGRSFLPPWRCNNKVSRCVLIGILMMVAFLVMLNCRQQVRNFASASITHNPLHPPVNNKNEPFLSVIYPLTMPTWNWIYQCIWPVSWPVAPRRMLNRHVSSAMLIPNLPRDLPMSCFMMPPCKSLHCVCHEWIPLSRSSVAGVSWFQQSYRTSQRNHVITQRYDHNRNSNQLGGSSGCWRRL